MTASHEREGGAMGRGGLAPQSEKNCRPGELGRARPFEPTRKRWQGEGACRAPERRGGGAAAGGKSGGGYRDRVRELVRGALAASGPGARQRVAGELGISPRTLEAWLIPSRSGADGGGAAEMRASALAALLCREDLLTPGARRRLWEELAREAGVAVVDLVEADQDTAPVSEQVMEVMGRVGEVAVRVRAAVARGGEGGEAVTPAEARRVLEAVRQAAVELRELELTLEEIEQGQEVGR